MKLNPKFLTHTTKGEHYMISTSDAFRKVLKKLHKQVQERDGKLRIFLQEHIGSMMMIRSFAAEQQTETESDEKMQEHRSARMKKNHCSLMKLPQLSMPIRRSDCFRICGA